MGGQRPLSRATLAVTAGRPSNVGDPLNQPIVLASNFRGGGDYTRTHGTETWAALETAVGELEGGRAVAFASGMAAAAAIVYALAPKVVVIPTFSYLGVRSLLSEYRAQGHVELRPVDITDTAQVGREAVGADVVWAETPTNPTLDVADLPAIAAAVPGDRRPNGGRFDVRQSRCCSDRWSTVQPSPCTAAPSSSEATATC
jgi:cystathionine gamma-synthase